MYILLLHQTSLRQVVDDQVTVIPEKASEGLVELAKKRKEEIDNLKDELLILEDESGIVRPTETTSQSDKL